MNNYDNLQKVLKEIFEMDKADLDFGIYRIMNQKRKQVEQFINETLKNEVDNILSGVEENDKNALEQEVFSHLTNFFKRYYKDGDFISMRRYKEGVYAIPYQGEEVKLHWANHDQYYIKTSENFKNYSFKMKNGKFVHFRIVEASTEQNNNKAKAGKERYFDLCEKKPMEVIEGNTLYINFTYTPKNESKKAKDLVKIIENMMQEYVSKSDNTFTQFTDIFTNEPTESDKQRTVLQKHINRYIAKNSFDYFIHKDLSAFLKREMDFYIKNEVLNLDDINTENTEQYAAQLAKMKALKTVAAKIIAFLAQIENFQKKLWLKKKFVLSTDYCITLDRIPEKYYTKILENEDQKKEWKALFKLDVANEEDLKTHKYLVLDTKHFPEDFKDKLLAEFPDLDGQTNGLLINSENFQALNLMQEKYKERVKNVYIDPPYNTSEESFVYKNLFKHSSWIAMMENRLRISRNLLTTNGVLINAIDDEELYENKHLLDSVFDSSNFVGNLVLQTNPRGRSINGYFATSHDYLLYYGKDIDQVVIENQPLTDEQIAEFNFTDDVSKYRLLPFRRSGGLSTPNERPNSEFNIYYNVESKKIVAVGGERKNNYPLEYSSDEYLIYDDFKVIKLSKNEFYSKYSKDSIITIQPIDTDGNRRVWRWSDREKILEQNYNGDFIVNENNNFTIQLKDRIKDGRKPKTIWYDSKYDASTHGTNLLKDILGEAKLFGYPKSINNVYDAIHTIVGKSPSSLILDYFAGSGTTGHATIKLNREDGGNRKYILVEMGNYFDSVTKPRIQKVIYTDNWREGTPQDTAGISQMFKYQVLESYEDTLNNLHLSEEKAGAMLNFDAATNEDYLLNYMLDVESEDHLLNVDIFRNPFDYKLQIVENNELVHKKVDLVETFNYLIGLHVEYMQRAGDIKFVEGRTRDGEKTLVIWRNLDSTNTEKDINEETEEKFLRLYDGVRSLEFEKIYINGDHHFDNLRTDEDSFKVKQIEETFLKRMFNL